MRDLIELPVKIKDGDSVYMQGLVSTRSTGYLNHYPPADRSKSQSMR